MTLESIHEDVLKAINNKNPSVKAESVSFLARCFTKCTPKMLNKKFLNIFTPALLVTLNESGNLFKKIVFLVFVRILNVCLIQSSCYFKFIQL